MPSVCTTVKSEAADFCRVGQRRSLAILGHTGRTLTHRQQWSGPASWSCCSAARLRGLMPIVSASPSDVLVCKGDDLAARPETLLLLSVGRGGKESERGPAQGTGNTTTGNRCHGHPSWSGNSPPHQSSHPHPHNPHDCAAGYARKWITPPRAVYDPPPPPPPCLYCLHTPPPFPREMCAKSICVEKVIRLN